jgi:dTMP kinase
MIASASSRGRFITLEGIEGVGKSTNLRFIAGCLRESGRAVVVTREPGGTAVAERIRRLLLDADADPVPPMSELLLMFAARSAHVAGVIRPALDRGQWVVCDRFTDASYAYQGGGRGLPESAIATLEALVQGDLRPDLTILLDADWAATKARRADRPASDRFEQEGQEFFARVRATYLARASSEPGRIRVVDATAPLVQVQSQIRKVLSKLSRD